MEAAEVRARFEAIARQFAAEGAVPGVQFRRRALKVAGEAFLMLDDDGIVIRLPDTSHARAEALAEPGAEVFAVEAGRVPVPDWIAVPAGSAEHWSQWAQEAAKEAAGQRRPRGPATYRSTP